MSNLGTSNSFILQIVDLFLSFSKLETFFFLYVEKKIPSLGNKIPSFGIDNFISGFTVMS